MKKVTPFLWFDHGKAEEAARYYVSIFPRSKLVSVGPMVSMFRIEDQDFMALNGGPHYRFTPAVSFYVSCRTQKEIDTLWAKLSRGGVKEQCGWLRDRYGVSWQIIPTELPTLMRKNGERVTKALLEMEKIDLDGLRRAARG